MMSINYSQNSEAEKEVKTGHSRVESMNYINV